MFNNIFPAASSFLSSIGQSDLFIITILSQARPPASKLVFFSHLTMEVIGRRFTTAYFLLVEKIHFLNHNGVFGIEYKGQNLI